MKTMKDLDKMTADILRETMKEADAYNPVNHTISEAADRAVPSALSEIQKQLMQQQDILATEIKKANALKQAGDTTAIDRLVSLRQQQSDVQKKISNTKTAIDVSKSTEPQNSDDSDKIKTNSKKPITESSAQKDEEPVTKQDIADIQKDMDSVDDDADDKKDSEPSTMKQTNTAEAEKKVSESVDLGKMYIPEGSSVAVSITEAAEKIKASREKMDTPVKDIRVTSRVDSLVALLAKINALYNEKQKLDINDKDYSTKMDDIIISIENVRKKIKEIFLSAQKAGISQTFEKAFDDHARHAGWYRGHEGDDDDDWMNEEYSEKRQATNDKDLNKINSDIMTVQYDIDFYTRKRNALDSNEHDFSKKVFALDKKISAYKVLLAKMAKEQIKKKYSVSKYSEKTGKDLSDFSPSVSVGSSTPDSAAVNEGIIADVKDAYHEHRQRIDNGKLNDADTNVGNIKDEIADLVSQENALDKNDKQYLARMYDLEQRIAELKIQLAKVMKTFQKYTYEVNKHAAHTGQDSAQFAPTYESPDQSADIPVPVESLDAADDAQAVLSEADMLIGVLEEDEEAAASHDAVVANALYSDTDGTDGDKVKTIMTDGKDHSPEIDMYRDKLKEEIAKDDPDIAILIDLKHKILKLL